jgi:pimeloyl-ACP methyl ester carboxylesterase
MVDAAIMPDSIFHGGHGPRILLLHSGLSLWVEWRRVIDALTPGFEVLATTLPGSAGAPPLGSGRMLAQHVDYAMALMDERGWDDDVLTVGSSFGGCAAIELLARERAREVIAFAPPWAPGRGYCSARPGFPLTSTPSGSIGRFGTRRLEATTQRLPRAGGSARDGNRRRRHARHAGFLGAFPLFRAAVTPLRASSWPVPASLSVAVGREVARIE